MAKLPKRPFINIERACKELGCNIEDLTDCWLSNDINLYYMLQGEKISITKSYTFNNGFDSEGNIYGAEGIHLLIESSRIYKNEHIRTLNSNIKIKDGKLVTTFKAYGPFLIAPIRATQFIENTISIISPKQAAERTRLDLLNGGFCFVLYPNTKDAVTFDDVDHIDGLDFPVNKLFVMRKDIDRFFDKEDQSQDQDIKPLADSSIKNNRAGLKSHPEKENVILIARNTKNHYLEQGIDLGLNAIAKKIKNHEFFIKKGLPSTEQMSKWFKEADIQVSKTTKNFEFDLILKD